MIAGRDGLLRTAESLKDSTTLLLIAFVLWLQLPYLFWVVAPHSVALFAAYGFVLGFLAVLLLHRYTQIRARASEEKRQHDLQMSEDLQLLANNVLLEERDGVPKHLIPILRFAGGESQIHFLNYFLTKAWPKIRKFAKAQLLSNLGAVLSEYHTGVIRRIALEDVWLGAHGPRVTSVAVQRSAPDEVCLLLSARLLSRDDRWLRLRVHMASGPAVAAKVLHLRLAAKVKVVLKPLLPRLPGCGAVLLSLAEQPFFSFHVKVLGGSLAAVPGFEKMLERVIRAAMEDAVVWPSRFVFPLVDGDLSHLQLHPVGRLDISLLAARGLPKTDVLAGLCDPFVLLHVRQRQGCIKRSSTKHRTLAPTWNEGFLLEVEDPASQSLTVAVMDEEILEKAEFIGACFLPLSTLHPRKAQDLWLDIFENPREPKEDQKKGSVHLVVEYLPFETVGEAVSNNE